MNEESDGQLKAASIPGHKCLAAVELVNAMARHSVTGKKLGTTYIIYLPIANMVKIGYTIRDNAKQRVAELQKACPLNYEVLVEAIGGRDLEQCLHSLFAEYRFRDEWFRHEGELSEFIQTIRVERCKNATPMRTW